MDTPLTEIIRSILAPRIQLVPAFEGVEQLLLDRLEPRQRPGDGLGRLLVEIRRGHGGSQLLLFGLELFDTGGEREQLLLLAVAGLSRAQADLKVRLYILPQADLQVRLYNL